MADLFGLTAGGARSGRSEGRAARVGPPVRDDLVQCNFTAGGPNQLWLADITEHTTGEGKHCLCAIKDVYSNWVVGYTITPTGLRATQSPRFMAQSGPVSCENLIFDGCVCIRHLPTTARTPAACAVTWA